VSYNTGGVWCGDLQPNRLCPGSSSGMTCSRVPLGRPGCLRYAGGLLRPEITILGRCLRVASVKSWQNYHGINSNTFQIKGSAEATRGNLLPWVASFWCPWLGACAVFDPFWAGSGSSPCAVDLDLQITLSGQQRMVSLLVLKKSK